MYKFVAVNKKGNEIFSIVSDVECIAVESLFSIMSDRELAQWKANNYKLFTFPM